MLSRKEGHVGYVVFNNPERRNAVSLEMWEATVRILDDFGNDNDIRVVVLTGAGDKAFVSGADISRFESERANEEAVARYNQTVERANAAIYEYPKPTIAMIRGYCIGYGRNSILFRRPVGIRSRQFIYQAGRGRLLYADPVGHTFAMGKMPFFLESAGGIAGFARSRKARPHGCHGGSAQSGVAELLGRVDHRASACICKAQTGPFQLRDLFSRSAPPRRHGCAWRTRARSDETESLRRAIDCSLSPLAGRGSG